jgi:hypothetical protein
MLLLRRMGTRLQLRLRLRPTPLLRPLCSHCDLGEETLMCLPSELVLVATVAAGEELVLVVYHLILLLKAHSRNLRHNNIEHREIVGSSPFFLYGGTVECLSFFLRVRGFFFLSVVTHA